MSKKTDLETLSRSKDWRRRIDREAKSPREKLDFYVHFFVMFRYHSDWQEMAKIIRTFPYLGRCNFDSSLALSRVLCDRLTACCWQAVTALSLFSLLPWARGKGRKRVQAATEARKRNRSSSGSRRIDIVLPAQNPIDAPPASKDRESVQPARYAPEECRPFWRSGGSSCSIHWRGVFILSQKQHRRLLTKNERRGIN